MDQEKLIRSLKLQLRIERAFILLAALFFLAYWGYGQIRARSFAIFVDGKPIACLASQKSAERVLSNIKSSVADVKPSEVVFRQQVEIKRTSSNSKLLTVDEATKIALDKLKLRVKKYAILINGVPVVAVNTKADANAILEMAKEKYGSKADNLMEEPGFKEQVDVREMTVDLELYRAKPEDALDVLFGGTGGATGSGVYTVENGDVASNIAKKLHMPLSDLEKINPDKDLDRLHIGDKLVTGETSGSGEDNNDRPHLTVVVRSQVTRTEDIPYTTESVSSVELPNGKQVELSPGHNGRRNVIVADTYENGVKTGSEIVEETILRKPVPRRVAVGIR